MTKLFLGILLLSSFSAFAHTYKCEMKHKGKNYFFSVINIEKEYALIGLANSNISDADDEYQLRLQVNENENYFFKSHNPKIYPGYFELNFIEKKLTQTAKFVSETEELEFQGSCTKI